MFIFDLFKLYLGGILMIFNELFQAKRLLDTDYWMNYWLNEVQLLQDDNGVKNSLKELERADKIVDEIRNG